MCCIAWNCWCITASYFSRFDSGSYFGCYHFNVQQKLHVWFSELILKLIHMQYFILFCVYLYLLDLLLMLISGAWLKDFSLGWLKATLPILLATWISAFSPAIKCCDPEHIWHQLSPNGMGVRVHSTFFFLWASLLTGIGSHWTEGRKSPEATHAHDCASNQLADQGSPSGPQFFSPSPCHTKLAIAGVSLWCSL